MHFENIATSIAKSWIIHLPESYADYKTVNNIQKSH